MSHNQAVGASHDEPQIDGLQPGAKLLRGQYEIIRYLSNGGFGITYLARDSLDRDVVIKECYPGALCVRKGDLVEPADPEHQEDLRAIIDLFIQEARNHARLVHPNIVDVHQVFEDNNTAYIAMDLIRGCDLLDYVQDSTNESGPDFIVQVTEKMLSAVAFIHQSGMLHRDISPDNILIGEHSEPILIDFGAAREQAANQSAALLTLRVIKDGYSPHEFYVRGSEQGPSSDLYVLAATLYHAISGERPIDGQTRLNAFNNGQPDPYKPLADRFTGYPRGFLEAIDKAMEVHATDRLQSALDWLRMFRGPDVMFDSFAYRPVSVIVGMDRKDEQAEQERIKAESENAEAVVTALLAGNSDLALGDQDKVDEELAKLTPQEEPAATVDTVVQSGSGGNGKLVAGAVVAVAALAVGGFFMISGSEKNPEETALPPAAEEIATQTPPVEQTVADEPEPVEQAAVVEAEPVEPEPTLAEEPEVAAAQDQPVEQPEASATAPEAVEDPVAIAPTEVEPAEAEPEITAVPAEPLPLAQNQIAFGHWDVEIPFAMSRRRASTGNTIAITGIDAGQDMSVIGEWVQRGATIFTLNGNPVRGDLSFAAQILNDFTIDPDGYVRVTARYRPLGKTRAQNGLLALPALRVFGLENGITFEARHAGDAGWQTRVTGLPTPNPSDLKAGDILLKETQTGTKIDNPESLDGALSELVTENQPEAKLTILRNGSETTASMQLKQE